MVSSRGRQWYPLHHSNTAYVASRSGWNLGNCVFSDACMSMIKHRQACICSSLPMINLRIFCSNSLCSNYILMEKLFPTPLPSETTDESIVRHKLVQLELILMEVPQQMSRTWSIFLVYNVELISSGAMGRTHIAKGIPVPLANTERRTSSTL